MSVNRSYFNMLLYAKPNTAAMFRVAGAFVAGSFTLKLEPSAYFFQIASYSPMPTPM